MKAPRFSSLLPVLTVAIALSACRSAPPVKSVQVTTVDRAESATTLRATYEYAATPSAIAAGARRYFGEAARETLAAKGELPRRVVIQDATMRKTPSAKLCRVDLTGYAEPGGGWDGTVTDLSPLTMLAEDAEHAQREAEKTPPRARVVP